jgi:hypothetical protein
MKRQRLLAIGCGAMVFFSCSGTPKKEPAAAPKQAAAPSYFTVDPATAGTLTGTIKFTMARLTTSRSSSTQMALSPTFLFT